MRNDGKERGSDCSCDTCFASVQLKIEAGLKWWKDGFKARCYPRITVAILIPCLPHLPLLRPVPRLWYLNRREPLLRKFSHSCIVFPSTKCAILVSSIRDVIIFFFHPVSDSSGSAVLVPNNFLGARIDIEDNKTSAN